MPSWKIDMSAHTNLRNYLISYFDVLVFVSYNITNKTGKLSTKLRTNWDKLNKKYFNFIFIVDKL